MKIGPGVNTALPVYGVDGLFIQPQPDGAVRVMGTNGEPPLDTGANIKADYTLTADQWEAMNAFATQQPGDAVGHGG